MKFILRSVVINTIAIWITSRLVAGLSYGGSLTTLLVAALAFGLINIFVRPLLKIIMLPINLLTLGLFSWLINVLILYLTTLVVAGLTLHPFDFYGLGYRGFSVPATHISLLGTAILASFGISLIGRLLYWLFD